MRMPFAKTFTRAGVAAIIEKLRQIN